MPGGVNGRSGTAVFRENFVAICTHDRRMWIWIYLWICMDIWISTENLDMDMDMDGKFHIHGKPAKNSCHFHVLNNFVKRWPILIISSMQHEEGT